MSNQKKGKKVFRDPIYDLIVFDKEEDAIILDLIDTPEFQRLRRIRQLGLSNFTFTSGVHDRLTHSIGVAYLVGIMIDHISLEGDSFSVSYTNPDTEAEVFLTLNKKQLKILVRVSAILHDIGHGPFSHAFERAIEEVGFKGFNKSYQNQIHEQMGVKIIFDPNTKISKILDNVSDEILKGHIKYLVKNILIEKQFSPFWIKEIISSQFDCDRIDYLLRDAYMCGVNYATFDWKWIFNNIQLVDVKSLFPDTESASFSKRLAVNGEKGLFSLESFLVSRYHMHEQVYFHKTTQSIESLIKNIFKRVLKIRNENDNDDFLKIVPFIDSNFIDFFNNPSDIKSYLRIDDFYMISHFNLWASSSKDSILKELSRCITERYTFKVYKEYTDLTEAEKDSQLVKNKLTPDEFEYFFVVDQRKNKVYKRSQDVDQIFVTIKGPSSDSQVTMISKESFIVNSMPQEKILCRSFCHKGLLLKLQSSIT